MAMAEEAVRLARETGVAFVTGRHMGHTGRIGAYPEAIAAAGMVGIAVCSGPRSGHWVAPFGGREGRLATNPIAYAFPVERRTAGRRRFLDQRRAGGRRAQPQASRACRRRKERFATPRGQPTTDPSVLYADAARQPSSRSAAPSAIAARRLGMLVDVLAALLADDDTDDVTREGSNLAMLAIAADDALCRPRGAHGGLPPLLAAARSRRAR